MATDDIFNLLPEFPKLYVTQPHECSYFSDRIAATILLDPKYRMTNHMYSLFAQMGYRRSGDHVYRPHCPNCHACYSLRIPVDEFFASRSQRRIARANQQLRLEIQRASFIDEHYRLYLRYMHWRHTGGGMDVDDPEAYHRLFASDWADTWMYCLRDQDTTVAVAITDHLEDGLSAVYTFYEPSIANRGLGTYAILQQIAQAQEQGMPFVYLGYWIEASSKMSYKTNFHPYQLFTGTDWQTEPLIL